MSIRTRSVIAASLIVASGILSPLPVWSAEPANPAATNDAQQKCNDGTQDRAACLREIGAATQERHSGGLTDPTQKRQQQNATARCDDQPATARAACEARMSGAESSKSEGSVAGGGIIRETVTPASAPR